MKHPWLIRAMVAAVAFVCVAGATAYAAVPPLTEAELKADAQRVAKMSPEEAAWEKVLEENLGTFYLPLYKRDKAKGTVTAWDYVKDDPKLPRVLLIGDSISRGYTLAVRKALAGKANVHRAPENCGPAKNGLKKLDVWLDGGKWAVIHFNFGLHDRKNKLEEYEKNLTEFVERLKKTGAKLVWASTTPTPPGEPDYPAGAIEKMNEAAANIMKKSGVAVDDLYACILPVQAELQNPKDVHFKEPGYERMGRQVAKVILEALGAKAEPAASTAPTATSSSRAATSPRKPVDVYLIGGQSNATGQGYMASLEQGVKPDERVMLFHSSGNLKSGAEPYTWIPLRQASESPDRFGPELGFGNRLQQLQPDRKIAIIKHAWSGTNLYRDWAPGKTAADRENWGKQFKLFVETVEAGLKGLREQGYEPTIRGMLWQQGEGDVSGKPAKGESEFTGKPAEDYGKNLAHFIGRVREQFQCPGMLFVYGYVLPPPNKGEGRDLVRKGEKDVDQDYGSPLAVKGAFVVETDDLSHRATDVNTKYPSDHVHFGTAGTLELGRRMAEKMNAKAAPAK